MQVDKDGSGRLEKEEYALLIKKSKLKLEPPFDLDADWALCKKVQTNLEGELGGHQRDEVTYHDFEQWWKGRLGIDEADIPVLPESMVSKIAEAAARDEKRRIQNGEVCEVAGQPGGRSGKALWALLRPRLVALVRMRLQWGPVHDIYDSVAESRFAVGELPQWIRDPDSQFSAIWDLTQVALLLYVAVTVPLRAGFDIAVPLWSTGFFIDLTIDLYFVLDICLNFRTAYYNLDGSREERPGKIASNYCHGWFFIDFISTLPVSYLAYLGDDAPAAALAGLDGSLGSAVEPSNSKNLRALKALRLVRLSKMLRLARIKKILTKYSHNPHIQSTLSVLTALFTILFLVHIMTCFFYLIGKENSTMDNGKEVLGWVTLEEEPHGEWTDQIGVGTRYLTSTFYILNALEHGGTNAEKGYALWAELMRDFILGLVAGKPITELGSLYQLLSFLYQLLTPSSCVSQRVSERSTRTMTS